MCGIAGFVSPEPIKGDQLKKLAKDMGDALYHRGPDGEGVWTDPENKVALSHRRLSIVDLSPTGAQPMHSGCGNLAMVYNGEIYNAEELRKSLAKENIKFKGTSDTEVILAGFSVWGIRKTTEKLIGMFSIAVWNQTERSLTLVRDRLGIKPLYWFQKNGSLVFGSELKALKRHPDCPSELNRDAIVGFLRTGHINNPSTIYAGVHQLKPGYLLRWCSNADTPNFEQYWSLEEVAQNGERNLFKGSDDEAIVKLDTLLSDAVSRRMIADVPLGTFLSGGIDSSTVAALMQKDSSTSIKTFSIGFDEEKYDESSYASAVAKHLGTDHTEMMVTSQDALNVIPNLPAIFDEPFADASQIPTYLLSRLTREHVTVALSGDGGDELFVGYERYFQAYKRRHLINQPKILKHLEAKFLERAPIKVINQISRILNSTESSEETEEKIERMTSLLRDGSSHGLYRRFRSITQNPESFLLKGTEPDYQAWTRSLTLDTSSDKFREMQFIDTLDYLPDDILTKVDRASMACSLEARVPILDHRVVEFSWSLPQKMKYRNGQGKWLLRNLLYKYVPKDLIDRPKKGFGVPIGLWLRAPLREWAEELLSDSSLNSTHIFNTNQVRRIWKEHLQKENNWEHTLWPILCLQSWILHTESKHGRM